MVSRIEWSLQKNDASSAPTAIGLCPVDAMFRGDQSIVCPDGCNILRWSVSVGNESPGADPHAGGGRWTASERCSMLMWPNKSTVVNGIKAVFLCSKFAPA